MLLWRSPDTSHPPDPQDRHEHDPTCAIFQMSKVTDLADVVHPDLHLLLSFGYQVEGAVGGSHDEDEVVLKFLLDEVGPRVFQHFALVEVDDPNGLFGVVVPVVLQHVWVPTHAASAQHEPTLPPCLQMAQTGPF